MNYRIVKDELNYYILFKGDNVIVRTNKYQDLLNFIKFFKIKIEAIN